MRYVLGFLAGALWGVLGACVNNAVLGRALRGGKDRAVLGANLLRLKPGLEMKDGKLGVYKKYRGNIEAVYKQYVTERLAGKSVRPNHVFITESGEVSPAVLEELEALVRSLIDVKEIHHTRAGCTVSSHCGPKTLGVLFINE